MKHAQDVKVADKNDLFLQDLEQQIQRSADVGDIHLVITWKVDRIKANKVLLEKRGYLLDFTVTEVTNDMVGSNYETVTIRWR